MSWIDLHLNNEEELRHFFMGDVYATGLNSQAGSDAIDFKL
jgi:hypothetical protein